MLVSGALFICALQIVIVSVAVKLFGQAANEEEAKKVANTIALTALTAPYLIGGWLIAYRSVGRTILLAAVAALVSVAIMAYVAPHFDATFSFDSTAMLGVCTIAFFCALVGAFIGKHTPGHR